MYLQNAEEEFKNVASFNSAKADTGTFLADANEVSVFFINKVIRCGLKFLIPRGSKPSEKYCADKFKFHLFSVFKLHCKMHSISVNRMTSDQCKIII